MRRAAKVDANQPEIVQAWKCAHCGIQRELAYKRRAQRFCSKRCSMLSRPNPIRLTAQCQMCSKTFPHSPSQQRKFCSYACHIASGGAIRAGLAASEAIMRYGAKKDANHKELVTAFEQMGCAVIDVSGLGKGLPDTIIWFGHEWGLVELKNPNTGYGRRGLNKNQKAWANDWKGGEVHIVRTVEEVAALVRAKREKHYGLAQQPPHVVRVATVEDALEAIK